MPSTEERAARRTEGYGLVRIPLEEALRTLQSGRLDTPASTRSLAGRTDDPGRALEFLSTLTHPATRHVLCSAGEGWTAAVNNDRNGSTFADDQYRWGPAARTTTIRVVDQEPRVWKRGGLRETLAWEARLVEVRDAEGRGIRTVSCMNDGGRWTWDVTGKPLPVEAGFPYGAKRIKDRFTRDHLRAFLAAVPAPPLDAGAFLACRSFALLEETYRNADWAARIRKAACTEAERDDPAHGYYQRALGWMEHLGTHAASAIADFERALKLNPAYEERIRPHLERARRGR